MTRTKNENDRTHKHLEPLSFFSNIVLVSHLPVVVISIQFLFSECSILSCFAIYTTTKYCCLVTNAFHCHPQSLLFFLFTLWPHVHRGTFTRVISFVLSYVGIFFPEEIGNRKIQINSLTCNNNRTFSYISILKMTQTIQFLYENVEEKYNWISFGSEFDV